jgi:signal transduction histidine kinase
MRTPLSALAGALKMFEETHMSPEQRELLDIALQCVQDILAARTQALAMRDIDSGKTNIIKEPFHIKSISDSVVFVLRVLAKQRHQELVSIVDPALPDELIGDGVAIRRILVNLLSNAIKVRGPDSSSALIIRLRHPRPSLVVYDK